VERPLGQSWPARRPALCRGKKSLPTALCLGEEFGKGKGSGLTKERQIKVGCCGFAAAQKRYFELFNNNTMKEDALRFLGKLKV
jgi:hypothetical protein